MDEVKTVRRLVNLSPEEEEELQVNEQDHLDLARELITAYDKFESGKVKVGRLTTLHENIVYKINFSYRELYRTANELRTAFEDIGECDGKMSKPLMDAVEDFLSKNKERKEFSS